MRVSNGERRAAARTAAVASTLVEGGGNSQIAGCARPVAMLDAQVEAAVGVTGFARALIVTDRQLGVALHSEAIGSCEAEPVATAGEAAVASLTQMLHRLLMILCDPFSALVQVREVRAAGQIAAIALCRAFLDVVEIALEGFGVLAFDAARAVFHVAGRTLRGP